MKDCIVFILIGWILCFVFFRPLGELIDKDNGDYKKNNKYYKMEMVK